MAVHEATAPVPGGPGEGPLVRQRLCLVAPTSVDHDSRTHRIASSIAARGHDVTVLARRATAAQAGVDGAGYRIVRAGRVTDRRLPGLLRAADRAIGTLRQGRAARAADPRADLYHGMAFMGLPVALELGRRSRAPVLYDARDLYVDARSLAGFPRAARSVVGWRERTWARRASRVVTVNSALADVLAARLGVAHPAVVMNCPPRWDPGPVPERRFHAALGLEPGARVLLFHGGLERDRGIEQLLALRGLPGDAHLVLLGYGSLRPWLAARLAAEPSLAARVHLLEAVSPGELRYWVASADVVLVPYQPTNLNHRLATPNKLFEALGAGVPVVASDFPALRRVVLDDPDGPLGAVCDPTDPAALATAIRSLLDLPPEAMADLRRRCLRAAHERYCWETQLDVLLGLYASLTGRPW